MSTRESFPVCLPRRRRLAIALLLFIVPLSLGQLKGEEHDYKTLFPHLMQHQKQIWTFPVAASSWSKRATWLCIALPAPSFALDGDPSRRLRENPDFNDFNTVFASRPADIVLPALPFALMAAGEISKHDGLTEFGWKASEAALDAFVVSTVLRAATQRSRPHTGREYGFWEGGNSFPSGHSMMAWSIAATTAGHFKEKRWVAWVVYPLAGVVSFSRVTSGNHFVSDAVVGSTLGFVIGRYVVD